jgi:hypothetical protein
MMRYVCSVFFCLNTLCRLLRIDMSAVGLCRALIFLRVWFVSH